MKEVLDRLNIVRVFDAKTGKLKRIELASPYDGHKTRKPKIIKSYK